jgi:hypothetical protein
MSIAGVSYMVDDALSLSVADSVERACSYAPLLGYDQPIEIDRARLTQDMKDLRFRFDREFAIQRAVASADDSGLTKELVDQDMHELSQAGSLVGLIRQRQEASRASRFNEDRVRECFQDDEEFEKLLSIARDGAIIDPPVGFVPQTEPEPLRPLNRRLEKCLRQHALKLHAKKRCIFIDPSQLPQSEAMLLNTQSAHWVVKPEPDGKTNIAEGRMLIDPQGLNAEGGKEKVKERYGPLRLASFSSIVSGWYKHIQQKNLPMSEFRIFKDDVEGAFPQFNFHPTSALLLVVLISIGLLILHIVGNFGWTGSPFVWGIIGGALERKGRLLFDGTLDVYVDDFVGFAHMSVAVSAQVLVQQLIRRALGDTAVNLAKSVSPTPASDVLGWTVSLLTESFWPNMRGCSKILFSFFSVDIEADQPRKVFEVLGGLATRYAEGLQEMKPYVSVFYAMAAACGTNPKSRKKLSSRAKFCIEMWRVVAIMLWYDPTSLSRPLRSVTDAAEVPPMYYLWSDASPWKLAAILYDASGREIAHSSHLLVFHIPESFQNVREHMAYLFGLMLLVLVTQDEQYRSVAWVGDNRSALSWVESEICKSQSAQVANMIDARFRICKQMHISMVSHCPGVDIGDVDNLSRDRPTPTLDPSLLVDAEVGPIRELLDMCNPMINRDCKEHHLAFLDIHRLVSSISSFHMHV